MPHRGPFIDVDLLPSVSSAPTGQRLTLRHHCPGIHLQAGTAVSGSKSAASVAVI